MKVVIVGGVAGGAGAAARLRRNDEYAEIVMLEKGPHISFANCGLPYYVGGVIQEEAALLLQTPQSFRARFHVDVRVNSEVTAVDTVQKTVSVTNHETGERYTESYDKLILSPGASPIRPPIAGADLPHVFTLRNVPDTIRIKAYLDANAPKTAAVIGGGYIGLEMAENLAHAGLSVSVVEAGAHVIGSLDADMAHAVHNHLRDNGVALYLDRTAQEITEREVRLNDGTCIPADVVVLSVGVAPATGFLAQSGIPLGPRGEILVDDRMTTGVPDVYAVGDAVSVTHVVSGQTRIVPLASPANKQARIVADVVCGRDAAYTGAQGTAIAKVFRLTAAVTGESEEALIGRGADFRKCYTISPSHAGYYPGGTMMTVKLLFDPEGYILGAQIVGQEGVDKRIDVLASALRAHLTVYDLQELELSYAPPFSSAKDPVNMAGYVAGNILDGLMRPFYLEDISSIPQDATLLDVRTLGEFRMGHLPGAVHLPLDEMRDRLDELDKNKPIYAYCRVGQRGYIAQRILMQHGFTVFNLSGGYLLYEAAQKDQAASQS